MSTVLIADVLIIAGLLVTLGLLGVVLGTEDERAGRLLALVMLAAAVTVIAAGRRQGTSQYDVVAWTLAAVTLPRLWWPQRSSSRDAFATLSLSLGVAAFLLTLMWGAR